MKWVRKGSLTNGEQYNNYMNMGNKDNKNIESIKEKSDRKFPEAKMLREEEIESSGKKLEETGILMDDLLK